MSHIPLPGPRHAIGRPHRHLAVLVATCASLALLGLVQPAAPAEAHPAAVQPAVVAPAAPPLAARRHVRSRPHGTLSVRAAARQLVQRKIMKVASSRKGTPYRYGGTGRGGFDCSGYTRWVFGRLGVGLPHNSAAQVGRTTRTGHPRVGDLVFFRESGHVYHVGIYAGRHQIWHAPYTGARVRKERLWTRAVSYGHVKGLRKALKKARKQIVRARKAGVVAAV